MIRLPRDRRPALGDLSARRIALLKPSALGDIVHTLPLLGALRARFPRARISWVVNRAYVPLLEGNPDLDEVFPFDRGMMRGDPARAVTAALSLASALRRRRFDLALDLQGLARTGLMTLLTGARRRVGFANAREGAVLAYTDRIAVPDPEMHAVDRYWLFAEALGCGNTEKRFFVPVPPAAEAWAAARLAHLPRPWVALAPGARWLTKRWPAEHFAELARRGIARFGGSALAVGAPDEACLGERALAGLPGPTLNLAGRTTLSQLAAVLSLADVVVGNDSGPLHLAAALGRPVVAPYTCTSTRKHGPYGRERGPVESAVWCQGSYRRTCERLECHAELRPERLWFFLHEALAAWSRNSRSA